MRRLMRALLVVGGLVIISAIVASVPVALRAIFQELDIGHQAVEHVPRLHGKTLIVVEREVGRPHSVSEFTITQVNTPLRCSLRDTYQGVALDSCEPIREATYEYDNATLVIWYRQVGTEWVAINTCRIRKGVAF
jgi:hypothetical protein